MTFSVNTLTYTADKFSPDSVGYIGPAHTASVKDQFQLARVAAKPTTLFSGVARSSIKLTRTLTLTGALTPTGEAIIQVSVSIPVGASNAAVEAMCSDVGAFLDTANLGETVAKTQKIVF